MPTGSGSLFYGRLHMLCECLQNHAAVPRLCCGVSFDQASYDDRA